MTRNRSKVESRAPLSAEPQAARGLEAVMSGGTTGRMREVLLCGAVTTIGFVLLDRWAVALPYALPLALAAGSIFLLVAGLTYAFGTRGLRVIWLLLVVLWCAQVFYAAPIDGPIPSPGQRLLARGLGIPVAFGGWSVLALPFFVASWIWMRKETPTRAHSGLRVIVLLSVAWAALFEATRGLALITWDVEPTPYPPMAAALWMLLLLGPLPLILGVWMIRATSARSTALRPHRDGAPSTIVQEKGASIVERRVPRP